MSITERRLLRHLLIVLTLKLVVLTGLWWVFVRDRHVIVDPGALLHSATALVYPGEADDQ